MRVKKIRRVAILKKKKEWKNNMSNVIQSKGTVY